MFQILTFTGLKLLVVCEVCLYSNIDNPRSARQWNTLSRGTGKVTSQAGSKVYAQEAGVGLGEGTELSIRPPRQSWELLVTGRAMETNCIGGFLEAPAGLLP